MQVYMKSDMPYLGVSLPKVRALTKAAAGEHPPASVIALGATAAVLWRAASRTDTNIATRAADAGVAQED